MPGTRDDSQRLIYFARQMRKAPTDAEKKLWSLLRRRQIADLHFRKQVPVAGFIIDFCCLPMKLGVKADGGQHYDQEKADYDRRRSKVLAAMGITILRFSDYEILKHPVAVQEAIYRAVPR
jgi:very-short-patch-repair endonuclease